MTDTDGILDRCKCGEQADIIRRGGFYKVYQATCKSCGYATAWGPFGVMSVEWNRYHRGIK